VVSPAKFDESKNQNSLILLSKEVFASDTVTEVTAAIVDGAAGADSVAGTGCLLFGGSLILDSPVMLLGLLLFGVKLSLLI
jgi:hypothetical protein